jgi:hypothetical protein
MKRNARENKRTFPVLRLLTKLLASTLTLSMVMSLPMETAQAAALPQGWTNLRALGMGNAYTSVVSDADALFYNPAALAGFSGVNLTILDFRMGLNGIEGVQAFQSAMSGSGDIAETLNEIYGKQIWLGGGAKSAVMIPSFAMAGFANTELSLSVHNPPNPTIDVSMFFDYGIVMGGGVQILPGIWSVGMALRRVNRTGTTLPIGASTLATLDGEALAAEFQRRGVGYGLDLGTKLTLPGPVRPSLSFVYRDAGYTAFTHDEGAGAPSRIIPEMIVGGAVQIDAALISITPSFDYRYADRSDVQLGKKLNLGVEVDLPLLDLRAGLHQGYMTAGLGMSLGIIRADIATWGVELGEFPGQHEDRRYMVQFALELGVDFGLFSTSGSSGSDGGSSGGSGGKKTLKRRR